MLKNEMHDQALLPTSSCFDHLGIGICFAFVPVLGESVRWFIIVATVGATAVLVSGLSSEVTRINEYIIEIHFNTHIECTRLIEWTNNKQ